MCGLTHVWGVRRRAFGLMSRIRSGSGRTAWPPPSILTLQTRSGRAAAEPRGLSRTHAHVWLGLKSQRYFASHPSVTRRSLDHRSLATDSVYTNAIL